MTDPDRPLLPGDVRDEDHLRFLLATAGDRTEVGPPPVAAMLRHHRVRRRSRLLLAAAVVVAGAGVGLATSVPFDREADRGPATAASEDVGRFAEPGPEALGPGSADYSFERQDAADGVPELDGVVPSADVLDGTWAVVAAERVAPSSLGDTGAATDDGTSHDAVVEAPGGVLARLSAAPATATLYFGDGGTLTAWTGCEAGAGSWAVEDGAVRIELSRGVPLCDDGSDLLAALAAELRSVRTVDADDGTRVLLAGDGRVLAVLRRP